MFTMFVLMLVLAGHKVSVELTRASCYALAINQSVTKGLLLP